MAVSRALRRLLHIRGLEEEQSREALESALAELKQVESALAATAEKKRRGRRLVAASVESGELPDRIAGLEEERAASHDAAALAPRVKALEGKVRLRRQTLLEKRVERRQAETVICEIEAKDAIEAGRRSQQDIDEWYLLHRDAHQAGPSPVDGVEQKPKEPRAWAGAAET